MQAYTQAPPPSKSELLLLRLMILIGTISLLCFLYCLLNPANIGHPVLYWMFVTATVFTCLRILHEWYHYLFITVPAPPPAKKNFTVDILTTFCPGEPYEMIVETLKAMQAVTYPHTSWLCDEADDPYLKAVCRELGVRHVTRNNRRDAKAGNINNALQYAMGELCVVLDPDHIPAPGFLDPIVPFFNDEKVGYVQIVQAYYNIGDSLIAKGAAQQTFQFYGPMMMSMNRYGTVLAIGANCTFRRSALDSIGGHAAGLAEDMHTSMRLHAKGWKSVYLPAVLTLGRVPSTLSAYYKQQLKWARGTFELLVTAFPRLFKKFSWAQRLHYCTIPFHYFSGIIFFINFLVPVLALMMGVIPFRMDLVTFTFMGLPFITSTLAVRHFVQRWVMGRGERGNHMLGGFLLIGTWWVHILGLYYTVIRKEVPYIPTPKDGQEDDNWRLNIPNAAVALVTFVAILYGLYIEWNPYTWMMAGIASLNLAVMLLNIAISRQKDFQCLREKVRVARRSFIYYKFLKQQFWNVRHTLYAGLRLFAFPIILFISFFTMYFFGNAGLMTSGPLEEKSRQQVFYVGLFNPVTDDGVTAISEVRKLQQTFNAHVSIVSLYIPWGDESRSSIPAHLADAIYRNGSVPLITWEPWASTFRQSAAHPELQQEKGIFSHIVKGEFDAYIREFALQIKALNRPVYLRFAHEPDNPAYPWSPSGGNTAEDFKQAWRYVHDLFIRNRVYNAIWVWNPWKPEAAERYFPGRAYVDWIGVTVLNYGAAYGGGYSFSQLYEPFHGKQLWRSGLPVMVAEGGALRSEQNQAQWMDDALKAVTGRFREIKAFVLFNTPVDHHIPGGGGASSLDWSQNDAGHFFSAVKQLDGGARLPVKTLGYSGLPAGDKKRRLQWADTIVGVNYQKGGNWFRNLHTLTRKEAARDFSEMRSIGVNTIRRCGPGVYETNILAAAANTGMNIHYGFSLPLITDAVADAGALQEQADDVLAVVRRLKRRREISAWYITNTSFRLLQYRYYKPAYLYQQMEYARWLKQLVARIKAEDPARPVVMDVEAGEDVVDFVQWLDDEIPGIDAFGIQVPPDGCGLAQLPGVTAPHFISSASVAHYDQVREVVPGAFMEAWQDQEAVNNLSFNGLLDHQGRCKPAFFQFRQLLHPAAPQVKLPPVKILRPAVAAKEGSRLEYRAVVRYGKNWKLAGAALAGLTYEWHLVRMDRKGKPIAMQKLGEGPDMAVDIPFNPAAYRLYLTAARGNRVVTATASLHTPL
ncbi:glycosyltransferase [Chitinophaga lutea]|uniref:Glycosyltransferase n=1 Tax=Chitinophaga lutea TaxID=2488634 RepID=A0A3N4QE80_9BACT|nr:glycosyltransferase family 2 protein [Chitinophaga lutea]RPE14260.1 glycosyltransferase [Chitinophaga lutea]